MFFSGNFLLEIIYPQNFQTVSQILSAKNHCQGNPQAIFLSQVTLTGNCRIADINDKHTFIKIKT